MRIREEWNAAADAQRRATAAWVRVVYEWKWGREQGSGQGDKLTCPAGALMDATIRGRMAAGPAAHPVYDNGRDNPPTGWTGDGVRWVMLRSCAYMANTPLADARRQLSLLRPPVFSGEIAGPAYEWMMERANYGRMFLARQSGTIGLQSMAVRPVIEPFKPGLFYPAGVVEIPPDMAFAIADPSEPGRPAVFGAKIDEDDHLLLTASGRRWARGGWTIWDLSDPEAPTWGQWASPEDWQRGKRPDWFMTGVGFYPWSWQGRPVMAPVCQQWDETTRELLPCDSGDAQGVMDLMLMRAWINYLEHQAGISRTYILSDHPMAGFGQMLNEPGAVINLFGPDAKQLVNIPHGMDGIRVARDLLRENTLEWAGRYDTGFEVRDATTAKSGVAIRLELTGKQRLRKQMEDRARVVDTRVMKSLIATHNYLIRSGQMAPVFGAPGLIPEGSFSVRYPTVMDSVEAAEVRKAVAVSVDRGEEYAERLWLLDRGYDGEDPGSERWQEASAYIDGAQEEALRRASRGYGLRWEARYAITSQTVEDETETFIPPPDVADTAARGLMLRDSTGVGLDGWTAEGKRLLGRARRLREQEPLTRGQTRELNTWLRQHTDDRATDPGWDNAAQPSAAWVEYLSQGGDPGLAWTNSVLMVKEAVPAVEPVQEPAPEGA